MYKIIQLSNGVRVVMEKIPYLRSIAFGLWVKSGSRNENKHNNGISHFIEHMLFKGTKKRSAKDIADEMDAIGGQINAYTSKEYTCYYTRTLDTHMPIAIDVLADMFFNSLFESTEIEKELNVILEEINMYEDTPEELVHDLMHYNIWSDDTLGFSILGTENSIKSFDNKTFKKYHKEAYSPENTVISIAGNFSEAETIELIEKYFGSYTSQDNEKQIISPPKYHASVATKEKDIEQIHMVMGFPSIPLGSDDTYAMVILNTVLGGGMSSRLFQSIREEHGLVYSIYSYNSSYSDTGLFSIYAGLNPNQTQNVFGLITKEIKGLFTNKITSSQLVNTKEQIKSNYLLSLESSASRMNSIGKNMLMLNRIISPEELIEKIDSVSLDRIYILAEKIFNFDNLSLTAVGNLDGINFKDMVLNV